MAFGRSTLPDWPLDPEVTYLNHGTVGVTPRRVLAFQQKLRDEMERQPSRFVLREAVRLAGVPRTEPGRVRLAAEAVAAFVGARGADVVFVDNATSGATAVVRSLRLQAGDEVVVTDHGYGGVTRVAQLAAREVGAHVRTATLPYPAFDAARLLENLDAAIGPRTRLVVVDHITADSALILPIAEIAARCPIPRSTPRDSSKISTPPSARARASSSSITSLPTAR